MSIHRWRDVVLLAAVLTAGVGLGCQRRSPPQEGNLPPSTSGLPRIVVDPTRRFQTMSGWEATAQAGQDLSPTYPAYRDQLLDRVVDELGHDRLRVEIRSGVEYSSDPYAELLAGRITEDQWRPVRYATVNDNGDPRTLNLAGFHFTELDNEIEKVVIPMKQRLEARGRRFFLNVCYVAFTGLLQPGQYVHQDPEEYAEFVQAVFVHMADRYGFVPDAWEMILEPDNSREWTAAYLRQAMVATGNRLASMGLSPKIIAPSNTNMARALEYADVIAQGGLPRFWSTLSYHRYSGVSVDTLRTIASRAQQWGLETAMLEHMGSGYETLHEDLKVGNNSAWQRFILTVPGMPDNGGMYYVVDISNPSAPKVGYGDQTAPLLQYFRYIRTGAVRIGANHSDGPFDPVAFLNPGDKMVVVVKADRGGSFEVEGLSNGAYEVTYTSERVTGARLGTMNVPAGSRLTIEMPDRGVVTIAGS